jgi:hypothetical protein
VKSLFIVRPDWRLDKMREPILRLFFSAVVGSIIAATPPPASPQSQALNGQIEGTASDQNRAAVPNAVITVTNIETGATRSVTSDESGVYRFPLLPLGTYRITAEAANFKKFVRAGITLTTGQTATVDLNLPAGEVQEVVTVSSDTSVADAGKTDLGRVMNNREVQNLPLVSRNPYNFALLQANVTGRPSRGYTPPMINANGYLRRVNYLLDGNTNTQSDRGTVRLMLISDTYVSEVQLMTNGFAAEFGNTPGMIMNVVTPSGTNRISGSVSYRFRRPSFYSRPFFYPSSGDIPDSKVDTFTAAVGGPIIKDRWHFYFGYENGKRDDRAAANRLLTTKPDDRARLIAAGMPAATFPAAVPSIEKGPFYIFRTDVQLNDKNRLTARFNHSDLVTQNVNLGGLITLDQSTDTSSVDYALAAQVASYTPHVLNEFRFQHAHRENHTSRNEFSASGPSIVISNVASFGSPENAGTINPLEKVTQVQDNLTWARGTHMVKFGGGFNFIDDLKRSSRFARYTFASITAYLNARNGTNPRSYSSYVEAFGDPEIAYKSTYWNFFAQDDWKLTRRLKFNYGLRYDLYRMPRADSSSPFRASQHFNVDKDNFAPRLGVVYALREGGRPTVLRAGAGIYYDTPWLNTYERALLKNGNPRFFNFSFPPTSPNAPAFPNTFSGSLPAGSVLPAQDIDTVASDFENMYAIHSNVQIEQAITENLSLAAGYIHSGGRHIAVYRNINLIPTRFLADGRPVFDRAVNSATRFDPRFNNILIDEAAGVSRYDALTLQLTRRFSRGLQFSANYTLSKATDDAPEQNLATGNIQNLILTDPYNRRLDQGNSFADQRHTFVMTLVAGPSFNFENRTLRHFFENNQIGVFATANSGGTFNIVSTSDLNNDGVTGLDRPVGIERNSGKTPPQYNVDLRYSRFFNFTERYRLEVFGEFVNLLNVNSIVQFTNVAVTTNANGELVGGLPDFKTRNQSASQESRQFQLGFKFIF